MAAWPLALPSVAGDLELIQRFTACQTFPKYHSSQQTRNGDLRYPPADGTRLDESSGEEN